MRKGADAISAEVYKAGGLPMAEKVTELFQCLWSEEAIPQRLQGCFHNPPICAFGVSQWYQWYTNIVQGFTNGTIGNTICTNGNANGTIGSTNGTIGKIANGTIGRTLNDIGIPLVPI